MRSTLAQSLAWGAFLVFVFTKPSGAANCVLYARAETGVALFGDAGGWWEQANDRYQRGHAPAVGAILVFKRTQRIPSGHVAVVAKVVSGNEVIVDHANWYRGRVNRGMSVIDTSPGHDWTSVAVIDLPSGMYGRDYPTYGFVYPVTSPREIVEARDNGQHDAYVVDGPESLDFSAQPAFLRVAFGPERQQFGTHRAKSMRGNQHPKGAAGHLVHKASMIHAHPHGTLHATLAHPSHQSYVIAAPAHAPTRTPTRPIKTAEAKHYRA